MKHFEIGQKVWCLTCCALYEWVVTSKCKSMDDCYYIRTPRFEHIYTDSSIFAYPGDANLLLAELEEEISCIESNMREVRSIMEAS
jgi:hypothetical protein